ncbi:MAG TPA: hypothetical protein VEH62_11255 [Gemmatimonadales bacterium]|nr:hypothetical protein [Gemmatimonadales bacterium]
MADFAIACAPTFAADSLPSHGLAYASSILAGTGRTSTPRVTVR